MIYLLLAVLLSTLIVVTFKLFVKYQINNFHAIVINYLVAFVLGLTLSGSFTEVPTIPHQKWFIMALLSGFFLMFVFNVFALSSQKVGIAITAVSSKMSVVIPVFLGYILYEEKLGAFRIAGILLALLAFYLTFKKESKSEFKKIFILLPVLLFFGNGTNDSLLNYAERRMIDNDLMFFLSSAFLVSFLIGVFVLTAQSFKQKQKIETRNIIAGIILGLLNFGSTYYFLLCLGIFDASFFFPVFNVSIVTSAALIGYFYFSEKLLPVNWVGIALAITAIIVMALA